MSVLITGGAGFIGSHLAENCLNEGKTVIVIDDLSTGRYENIAHLVQNNKFTFIRDDVKICSDLDNLASKCKTIYHLAAAVGVELVIKDPIHTMSTNIAATEKILEAASKHSCRVVMTSTSEVYGKSTSSVFAEDDDLIIGSPRNSRWSYACSKLLDEFYCMSYYSKHNLPVVIARLFNTVGPRQTGRYGMVVPRFVKNAVEGKDLEVYGTGKQTRCFCHVKDTVRGLVMLGQSSFSGEIFNIGSSHNITIEELAMYIIAKLKSKSKIRYIPYNVAYELGFEDMLHRFPHVEKIRKSLGWRTEFKLGDIIDDVAKQYC